MDASQEKLLLSMRFEQTGQRTNSHARYLPQNQGFGQKTNTRRSITQQIPIYLDERRQASVVPISLACKEPTFTLCLSCIIRATRTHPYTDRRPKGQAISRQWTSNHPLFKAATAKRAIAPRSCPMHSFVCHSSNGVWGRVPSRRRWQYYMVGT